MGVGHLLAAITGTAVMAWGPWLKGSKHWWKPFWEQLRNGLAKAGYHGNSPTTTTRQADASDQCRGSLA